MTTYVWVVEEGADYEESAVLGVFSSKTGARNAVLNAIETSSWHRTIDSRVEIEYQNGWGDWINAHRMKVQS